MTTTSTKKLTFDQWQALPETKQRCEVVDGVLLMPPGPMGEHPWIADEILLSLRPFVRDNGLGIALSAPYDVLIQREPLRVRQPDVLVVNAELTGITRPSDLVGRPFLERPPLLVVEVLSPSNTRRDITQRLADYRSIGVPELLAGKLPRPHNRSPAPNPPIRNHHSHLRHSRHPPIPNPPRFRPTHSQHFRPATGLAKAPTVSSNPSRG